MSSVWNKLDSGLSSIYSNYLRVRELGADAVAQVHPVVAEGGRLNVSMQYAGDLAEIEAFGFQPIWREEIGRATGTINLADLERLAEHSGVLKMSFGEESEPMLDRSIPDIRANQIWSFSSGTFGGMTGKNVIVGILDTGIDFRHPFFLKTTSPKTTRILRIWDPGLQAEADSERSPNPARLTGSTYGVEYTDEMINAVLQERELILPGKTAPIDVRHRDCNGHGTHVASIAAGDGRDKFRFIGVAPEADLIVVKYLFLQEHPRVGVPPARVGYDQIFRDAVSYVLNVAEQDFGGRPVVINFSVGNALSPHDGFTDDEDFLTDKFDGAVRKIFVTSAGNNAGRRQHLKIEFPVGGDTFDIPFKLYDRRTNRTDFNYCESRSNTRDLKIKFYYPEGPDEISVELDIPHDGMGFIAGPTFGGAEVSGRFSGKRYIMRHSSDNQVLRAGRGTVTRRLFEIEIEPHNNEHRIGVYMVRVSSPSDLTVHIWCGQSRGHGFRVDSSSPLPVDDHSLIGKFGGADNIITVAAYDAETAGVPVASFSSRGPLVSYGGAPPQPDKPDIAAPGVSIDAARSRDAKPKQKKAETQAKGGTSMAAPHVAGAVALMLQKNPNLTVDQVITKLTTHRRTTPPPVPEEVGAGRLDAKDAFDHA